MDATLVLIDSDAELARAHALVDRLWESEEPADIARLQAQARLIAAYEESKWPRRLARRSWEHRAASVRSFGAKRA
jgi:HTH-type transcriptional regulator/antitoxin HigA